MTQKLLSDEEIRKQLEDFTKQSRVDTPDGWEVRTYVDLEEALATFNTQKRLYAEMAISLDAEALMRVGNKSDNHRSHVPAYKAIIEEQRARIK